MTRRLAIGALVSWRWQGVGAVIVAVAAVAGGIFASVEYGQLVAVVTGSRGQHRPPEQEIVGPHRGGVDEELDPHVHPPLLLPEPSHQGDVTQIGMEAFGHLPPPSM